MAAYKSNNNLSKRPKQIGVLVSIFASLFLLAAILSIGCGDSGSLSSVIINPNTALVGVNQSTNFTALGRNAAGVLIDISPTWSVTGIGSVSTTGLFTAGDVAGVGTVSATSSGVSGTATVTVTENGWISGRLTSSLGTISGIRVYLQSLGTVEAFAGSDGSYTLSSVPPGTYIVITAATTVYQAASQEVSVTRGQTRSGIDFVLQLQPGTPVIPTTTNPL